MSTIFLLGATGYIGGSILVELRNVYPDAIINALIRSPSHHDAIRAAGAHPVQGLFDNLDVIEEQASKADLVINAAHPDNIDLMNAIMRGLKKRKQSGAGTPSFIHTSGGGVFLDGSTSGKYNNDSKVWTDREEDIKLITPKMLHGQVDAPLLKAGEDGYASTYIICPTAVHGVGKGPVAKTTGIYRYFLGAALEAGAVTFIGEGSNILSFVHVDDVVALFIKVISIALAGPPTTSPYERYFIATTEDSTWKEFAGAFAKAVHSTGKIPTAVPKSITAEEARRPAVLGSNSLLEPMRAREIGWEPNGASVYDTVESDIKILVASMS
ncbi:NAD(P)-binding protein [Rickenella mellea]|uniref:NAD(P)-binding protein n=1 Tax=Rickenella mellea TaxID=50990 RepID=A0A4Y7PVD6_9AGAM|nr:NAD(P)-binding protein [Rickenella mellea]